MGLFSSKKEEQKKARTIFVDLLSSKEIKQLEDFCNNSIKTTHYTM